MGTIREYGYREYPDHLSPAKGGLSNLLFDEARSLTTHATFHATEREETSESSDAPDLVAKGLAIVGAAALTFITVQGIRRAIRAKRSGEAADSADMSEAEAEQTAPAGATEHLESIAGADLAEVSDADDALIEEAQGLCKGSSATLKAYRDRRTATGQERADDEPRAGRSQKKRRAQE